MAYLTRDLSQTSAAPNYEALKGVDRRNDESRTRFAKGVAASLDEDDEAEFCVFIDELNKAMA